MIELITVYPEASFIHEGQAPNIKLQPSCFPTTLFRVPISRED